MTDEMKDSHLRRLRLQAGLTVRELARQVGTHHTNVSTWERSGKIAKTECLVSMADALGVTLEEVLGLEPSRSGPTPRRAAWATVRDSIKIAANSTTEDYRIRRAIY